MSKKREETVYSFSRLESFHTCQHGYYLTYVKGNREGDNIYSFMGSAMHEILEELQQGKISIEEAKEMLSEKFDDAELFGYNFMSDNVANKYEECLQHYLEYYEPIECDKFAIEEKFEFEVVDGIRLKGFIDFYYYDKDGKIVVLDYKTSSKFSAKDTPKKTRQLVLYGMALEHLYKSEGIEVKSVGFDMLKYVGKPWRGKSVLKERTEIGDIEMATGVYSKGYLMREYDELAKDDLKEYVRNTVEQIESLDSEDERDWIPCVDFDKSFFCKTLCNHYQEGICKFHNELRGR